MSTLNNNPITQKILEVKMEETQWLWQDRFASGGVNIVSGIRDTGKSTFLMYIAHKILCGGTWPFLPDVEVETGSVIYLTTENNPGQTTRPKMEALIQDSGMKPLDGNQFITITGILRKFSDDTRMEPQILPFKDLQQDLSVLDTAVKQIGNVRLILLDPIISYSGSTKGNTEESVRDFLTPLSQYAEKQKLTIIGLRHMNKNEKASAEQRTMGSSAWQDAPRAVWLLGNHPDDAYLSDPQEIRRTLTKSKCNSAIRPINLQFKLRSVPIMIDGKLSRGYPVCDIDSVPFKLTHDDVFDQDLQKQKRAKRTVARDWLADELNEGPQTVDAIKAAAKAAMLAWRTIERAAKDLDVVHEECKWSLPVR